MAYNHEYPYVDPNRYNSDWILNKIKELEGEMGTFEALNKITFSGEWDITKQYPAWTIVNDNNGRDGYISIQPVPAGVTIDNADYWRAVANYSDLIADLQNRVIALEGDVLDLADDIEDVAKRNMWHNKKVVVYGDSLSVVANNWTEKIVALDPTIQITNRAVSGYVAGTCYTAMQSATDLADFDILVFFAGTNDWQSDSSLKSVKTVYKNMIALMASECPDTQLVCVFPFFSVNPGLPYDSGTRNTLHLSIGDYANELTELVQANGGATLNLYNVAGVTKYNYATLLEDSGGGVYVHPLELLSDRIAMLLYNMTFGQCNIPGLTSIQDPGSGGGFLIQRDAYGVSFSPYGKLSLSWLGSLSIPEYAGGMASGSMVRGVNNTSYGYMALTTSGTFAINWISGSDTEVYGTFFRTIFGSLT